MVEIEKLLEIALNQSQDPPTIAEIVKYEGSDARTVNLNCDGEPEELFLGRQPEVIQQFFALRPCELQAMAIRSGKIYSLPEIYEEYTNRIERWHAFTYDSERLEIGIKKSRTGKDSYSARANFVFDVIKEVRSQDGGGLVLWVYRDVDFTMSRVFINSKDYTTARQFEDALKKALNVGVVCTFSDKELKALINIHLWLYHALGGKVYSLAERVGQQEDGTWVFPNCQFDKNGEPTTEYESGWIYNANVGKEDYIPSPIILPNDPDALKRLVQAQKRFFGPTAYIPAFLVLGYVAASIHYQTIIEAEGCFPILNLYGDPGSFKSLAVRTAFGLVGWQADNGMVAQISKSALYERLKLTGSIPICLDDPIKTPQLDETLKSLFNAYPREVRENYQKPHSAVIVTSNHACGDNSQATLSRLIPIFCSVVNDGDKSAWLELQEAQKKASGAFPSLIKIGYPVAEIKHLAGELVEHLPHAHVRVADSLALITYYSIRVAELAGEDPEPIKQYVLEHLCPSVNDSESACGSLQSFISGLADLYIQGKIDSSNCTVVGSKAGLMLAIQNPLVWNTYESEYQKTKQLTFSRNVIKAEIKEAGGQVNKEVRARYLVKDPSGKFVSCSLRSWLIPAEIVSAVVPLELFGFNSPAVEEG